MKKILTVCSLLLATSSMAQNGDPRLKGLDTFVQRVLRDWHTPGVSIAVVEKNKVLYAGGYGYRDYAKKLPVTPQTLFAIGSCTKAFTASMLGMLEAEGRLNLDKPVRDYMPALRFYNDELNAHVTIRDMMCHRTGLPRHDISWYGSSASRRELVERIQYLEPTKQLREAFQYNNFMFLAQGALLEHLTGKSWEANLKERILTPLGMNNTNMSVLDMEKSGDRSMAYTLKKDSIISVIPYRNIDAIGPAGSINSCAADMSKWLITWINGGKYNGKEIIPEPYAMQAMSQQMAASGGLPGKENADIHMGVYGLGWFLTSYRGHLRIEHSGGIDGFISSTGFFPTDSIGIFVVSSSGTATNVIRNFIADRLLRLPYRNWNKMQLDAYAKGKMGNGKRTNSDSLNRRYGTRPSHPIEQYAGNYSNPGYGKARLYLERDTLWIDYNSGKEVKSYLSHYHYDVFRNLERDADEDDVNATKVRFVTGPNGDIDAFEVTLEQGVKDIVFKKQPPEAELTRADLEKYPGEYVLSGLTMKVSLKGDKTLTLFVPGQPEYELLPSGKHHFTIRGLQGFTIKFDMDEKGEKSTRLHSIQPNGTFIAVRKQ